LSSVGWGDGGGRADGVGEGVVGNAGNAHPTQEIVVLAEGSGGRLGLNASSLAQAEATQTGETVGRIVGICTLAVGRKGHGEALVVIDLEATPAGQTLIGVLVGAVGNGRVGDGSGVAESLRVDPEARIADDANVGLHVGGLAVVWESIGRHKEGGSALVAASRSGRDAVGVTVLTIIVGVDDEAGIAGSTASNGLSGAVGVIASPIVQHKSVLAA
jgi:hypothetical protein